MKSFHIALVVMSCFVLASTASANVFDMGPGMTSLEFVYVGDPGNADDIHDSGYGGVAHDYSIGKFEITTGQYVEFLNAVAATDSYNLYITAMSNNSPGCKIQRHGESGSYTYSVAPDRVNRPVNYVSWGGAARFANWLENGQPVGMQDATTTEDGSYTLNGAITNEALAAVSRNEGARFVIPTEDEWYKAAYYDPSGDIYYDYPTGTNAAPSNLLVDPDPGNNANFEEPMLPPYYTTEVGEYENSASPYGTFDQGGNLWEWTETSVTNYSRDIRGGAIGWELRCLSSEYEYFNNGAGEYSYTIGFRVAQIPEPATLSLLVLGGVAMLRRRNK